jgi:hypothetical protein
LSVTIISIPLLRSRVTTSRLPLATAA